MNQAADQKSSACSSCGATSMSFAFNAMEMMYGSQDVFAYDECAECRSLQVQSVPENLAEYYPDDYYSFDTACLSPSLRSRLKAIKERAALGARFGPKVVQTLLGKPAFANWLEWSGTSTSHSILDVGCGDGGLVRRLSNAGCKSVMGIDPFMQEQMEVSDPGLVLKRCDVRRLAGDRHQFDLIMFNHSLEHIPDPAGTLASALEILSPQGAILLRLPVAGSWASKTYGEHWVQLDAPRHLAIPSVKGVHALADRVGLHVEACQFDSHGMQIYGSELYRQGIPLTAGAGALFSRTELESFEKRSEELNRTGEGDAACYVLRRPRR